MQHVKIVFFETINEIGANLISRIEFGGYVLILLAQSVYYMRDAWKKRKVIVEQMFNAGIRSFVVCSIVALFTGMILSLQAGLEMMEYKQQVMVGNLVIATLTREMSPFVSAIVLIASVGSSIAAEVATMKVSEEIDALEMMSISPVRFLVMPRVFALGVMFPVMCVYFTVIGVIGGGIVANSQLDVRWPVYYAHVLQSLWFKATYSGLLKSFIFGITVAGISCAKGLQADQGAVGVGKATRDSVISSFLMVLILGYFVTAIFYGRM